MPYKDPAARKAYAARYRKAHPGRLDEYYRDKPLVFRINAVRQNARRKGFEYTLSRDLVGQLLASPCHYCGVEPKRYGGIDRVDSALGYIEGNVVPSCFVCNRAKGNLSIGEFWSWAMRLVRHRSPRDEAEGRKQDGGA